MRSSLTLGRLDPGFSGDGGLAQSARFDAAPMAFAPNGDLYFADGKRIRKVTGAPPNQPAITGGGIVNAVSYASAAIAPGELVTIFGSGFGATELITNTLENNRLPTVLGRTKVLFDGRPGAIVAMTSTQINVFVPYSVVPGKSAAVIVQTDSAVSVPVIIPVVAAVPGLATADQTGSGPGAILNQDSSFNTAANPAARGSLVTLFGTGEGFVSPQLISGDLSISTPLSVAPVGPRDREHRRCPGGSLFCRRRPHAAGRSFTDQRQNPHRHQSRTRGHQSLHRRHRYVQGRNCRSEVTGGVTDQVTSQLARPCDT